MAKRKCKGCDCDISHKHPNAKFHSAGCKDNYWNRVNPRGIGLLSAYPNSFAEQNAIEDADEAKRWRDAGGEDLCEDFDPSWDAHKNY